MSSLPRVFAGDYRVVPLTTLDVEAGTVRDSGVNDVVALSSVRGRMVELAWALGGEDLGHAAVRRDDLRDARRIDRVQPVERRPGPRPRARRDGRDLHRAALAARAADGRAAAASTSRSGTETPDVDVTVLVDGHPVADVDGASPITIRLGERRSLLATLPEATFFRRYRETFGS